ncbi:hypothetical protein [Streptomyces venezuelae]|uniref:Uncharacterized protein n=1 Tax=Streptomyces venezuelae TaxID=54571 RepID=A0A5P2BKX4_STRVZ|nr:hypothetical protein [Streptomyces venezuelae]QES30680.1 hypothetical protein DEJ47_33455 [Streptomyces venezuelae]
MILASDDPGLWVLPVLLLLGAAVVAPLAGAVLAGRVVLRIARSAASGDLWSALTPGTWLLAAGAGALGAAVRLSAAVFDRPAAWVGDVSLVCCCFALAAVTMAGLTAVLHRHLGTVRVMPRSSSARGTRRP